MSFQKDFDSALEEFAGLPQSIIDGMEADVRANPEKYPALAKVLEPAPLSFTNQELIDLAEAARFTDKFYVAVHGDAPTELAFRERVRLLSVRLHEGRDPFPGYVEGGQC
jgi:hypothetical protein